MDLNLKATKLCADKSWFAILKSKHNSAYQVIDLVIFLLVDSSARTFLKVITSVWWYSAYRKVLCCSAIKLPSTSYPLYDAITDDIVDGGKLSQLQLESVMYASTKHLNFLPSGESKKIFTYIWASFCPWFGVCLTSVICVNYSSYWHHLLVLCQLHSFLEIQEMLE